MSAKNIERRGVPRMNIYSSRMREDWDNRADHDPLYWASITFGRQFQDVDAYFDNGRTQAIALMEPNLERLAFCPIGKRILEIGCGVGRLFPGFSELGFDEIWGVDVSPEMIARGHEWCPISSARFVVVDGLSLDGIDSNYFDHCFSYGVIQHFPALDILWRILDEVNRVLKPGGSFQLQFRGKYSRKRRILRLVPAHLRTSARKSFRFGSLRWMRGESKHPWYDPGHSDTWELGIAVSPKHFADRLCKLGLEVVEILPDPTHGNEHCFWVMGRKPLLSWT